MDRVSGAIMGALIDDALGLGCHWYYDLDAMRRDYGPWISDYTTPKASVARMECNGIRDFERTGWPQLPRIAALSLHPGYGLVMCFWEFTYPAGE